MATSNSLSSTTLAALTHISVFTQFLIPLGNFIFPLIIWTLGKKDRFVEEHAKSSLNFQLSVFLYSVFIIGVTISSVVILATQAELEAYFGDGYFHVSEFSSVLPLFIILGIAAILLLGLFVIELIGVITAAMKASEKLPYKYPITIPFIPSSNESTQRTA